MHNPLRSEADAFRWVVVIGLGAASVIALTLLTRPAVGAVWAAALIGFGTGILWRTSRGTLPRNVALSRGGDGKHRLLVVANQTVGGRALLEEIANRCRGRQSEILVLTPALAGSRAAHWTSDLDEGMELARQRMELSLQAIDEAGLRARGRSETRTRTSRSRTPWRTSRRTRSSSPPTRRTARAGSSTASCSRARDEIALPVSHVIVDLEAEQAGAEVLGRGG